MTQNRTTEDEIEALVSAVLLGELKMLTERGVSVQQAMRIVVMAHLQSAYGSKVWAELGLPLRTTERWRREVRAVLGEHPLPDHPSDEYLEMFERLAGGDR